MRPAAVSPYGPRGPFGGERHCCHYRRVIPRSQGSRCYLDHYFCTGRWSSVADGDHFERVARFDRAAARTGVSGPNASLRRPVSSRWAAASGPCRSSVRASRTAMTRPREATRPTTEHVGHRQDPVPPPGPRRRHPRAGKGPGRQASLVEVVHRRAYGLLDEVALIQVGRCPAHAPARSGSAAQPVGPGASGRLGASFDRQASEIARMSWCSCQPSGPSRRPSSSRGRS